MMTEVLFSPSACQFYFSVDVNCPSDAVEVTDEDHMRLVKELQLRGGKLSHDESGQPVVIDSSDPVQLVSVESLVKKLVEKQSKDCGFDSFGDACTFLHSRHVPLRSAAENLITLRDDLVDAALNVDVTKCKNNKQLLRALVEALGTPHPPTT